MKKCKCGYHKPEKKLFDNIEIEKAYREFRMLACELDLIGDKSLLGKNLKR